MSEGGGTTGGVCELRGQLYTQNGDTCALWQVVSGAVSHLTECEVSVWGKTTLT